MIPIRHISLQDAAADADIALVRQIIAGFTPELQELLEKAGHTIIIGHAPNPPVQGELYFEPGLLEQVRAQPNRYGLISNGMRAMALFAVCGDGLALIDWGTAATQLRNSNPGSPPFSANEILGVAATVIATKGLPTLQAQLPAVATAYEEYMEFANARMAELRGTFVRIAEAPTADIVAPVDGIRFRNDSPQNAMPVEDALYLRNEIIAKWPERERKLFGHKGLTVVVGKQWSLPVGPNEIYIGKAELDAHRQQPSGNFSGSLKYIAYQNTLGPGPITPADIAAAKEEFLRPMRSNLQLPGQNEDTLAPQQMVIDIHERNLNGPNALAHTLTMTEATLAGRNIQQTKASLPALCRIYEDYFQFVTDEMRAAGIEPGNVLVLPEQTTLKSKNITPRVIKDLKYGTKITQQDINILLSAHSQWEGWVKELIDSRSITFVIGGERPNKDRVFYDPSTGVVEVDVEMLRKPEYIRTHEALYMCEALLCAMYNKLPADIDWNRAKKEMDNDVKKAGGNPVRLSSASIKAVVLSSAHGTAMTNTAQTLASTYPYMSQAYKKFMAVAREESNQPFQPPQTFTPPDTLPTAQKRFFTALEKVRVLTRENPGELEYNIRGRLSLFLVNSPTRALSELISRINLDHGTNLSADITYQSARGSNLAETISTLPVDISRRAAMPDEVPAAAFDMEINHKKMGAALLNGFRDRLDKLLDQHVYPGGILYNADVTQGVKACEDYFEGAVTYGSFDRSKPLLEAYKTGTKPLHELSALPLTYYCDEYRIQLPSERDYLLMALEGAARMTASYKRLTGKESEKLDAAIVEMKAAYLEAVISPEERAAQEEAKRGAAAKKLADETRQRETQKEEDARKQAAELLKFVPYGMSAKFTSMHTRATRKGPPPPEKELAAIWPPLVPLTETLNRNLAPHVLLGDALFKSDHAQTLRVLDHIATSAPLPPLNQDARKEICDIIIRNLSKPLEQLVPEMERPGIREKLITTNNDRHAQLQPMLLQSPLLLIAALGTPQMIEDARALQSLLYPEKKKISDKDALELRTELHLMAKTALEQAFAASGTAIPDHVTATFTQAEAALAATAAVLVSTATPVSPPPLPLPVTPPAADVPPPPPPPAAPATNHGDTPDWEQVRQQTLHFINRTLPENSDYVMFRSRLSMEPGHALTLELARWVDDGALRRVDTRSHTIYLNRSDLDEALDIKKRVQALALNTPPIVAYRKLHNGHYSTTERDPLPDTTPIVDPTRPEADPAPGRVELRSGLWNLRLLFPDAPVIRGGPATLTEAIVPLGVEQLGSREQSVERRHLVLGYLSQLQTDNNHHRTQGQDEQIRRVTAQDLSMWLQQQVRVLHSLSRDAALPDADEPLIERRIRSLARTWQLDIPADMTARDWLTQQQEHIGTRWEPARTIDLSQLRDPDDESLSFPTRLDVNFPPDSYGKKRTTIIIEDPVLSGQVVPFWSANIVIYQDGKRINGRKRVNLHMGGGDDYGEIGSGQQAVIKRLKLSSHFIRDTLEAYGAAHPDANWHALGEPPALAQMSEGQLSASPDIDLTRLDRIVASLPYTGVMNVDYHIANNGIPDADNHVHFTLTFNREDGSQFIERRRGLLRPVPVVRDFSLPACEVQKDTLTTIKKYAHAVQDSFSGVLEECYSPLRDYTYEPHRPYAGSSEDIPPMQRIVNLVRHAPAHEPAGQSHANGLLKPDDQFNPISIVKTFDAACRSAAAAPDAQAAGIRQLPERTNGGPPYRPGDPSYHHAPGISESDETNGFRRYAARNNGLDHTI